MAIGVFFSLVLEEGSLLRNPPSATTQKPEFFPVFNGVRGDLQAILGPFAGALAAFGAESWPNVGLGNPGMQNMNGRPQC
jgi:hypothetical protein